MARACMWTATVCVQNALHRRCRGMNDNEREKFDRMLIEWIDEMNWEMLLKAFDMEVSDDSR